MTGLFIYQCSVHECSVLFINVTLVTSLLSNQCYKLRGNRNFTLIFLEKKSVYLLRVIDSISVIHFYTVYLIS